MNNIGIQDVIGTDIIDTSTKVLREHINKKLCRNISCVIQSFCYINTNVQPILATIVAQINSGTLSPTYNLHIITVPAFRPLLIAAAIVKFHHKYLLFLIHEAPPSPFFVAIAILLSEGF